MYIQNMAASDIIDRAVATLGKPLDPMMNSREDFKDAFSAARSILENENVLSYMKDRFQNADQIDVDFVSKVLRTRCIEIDADRARFRNPNFFLDLFRDNNLIRPINPGIQGIMSSTVDRTNGEVRFIGDKTDDWPTTGGGSRESSLNKVKYFGKSVEYGILELWQARCEGRDVVSERVEDAFNDIDVWLEYLIANGAPLHGIFGLLDHPNIPKATVPASVVNGPATDWPSKTPGEMIFDLNMFRDQSRVASKYNKVADTLLVSDLRYSFIGTTEIGTNGDMVLSRHLENQQNLVNGGLTNILPFVPYDTAGAGGSPLATAGTFARENIEMPVMPTQRLPVEYHGAKWKIGFVGAAASIDIKREGCFQSWEGI